MTGNQIKAALGKRRGTLTTIVDNLEPLVDDLNETPYFKVKGLTSCIISYLVTTNNLDVSVDIAFEDEDGLPERWHELFDAWQIDVAEDMWDWLFLRYDFIRVQARPAVAATHGTLVVTISGGSVM